MSDLTSDAALRELVAADFSRAAARRWVTASRKVVAESRPYTLDVRGRREDNERNALARRAFFATWRADGGHRFYERDPQITASCTGSTPKVRGDSLAMERIASVAVHTGISPPMARSLSPSFAGVAASISAKCSVTAPRGAVLAIAVRGMPIHHHVCR